MSYRGWWYDAFVLGSFRPLYLYNVGFKNKKWKVVADSKPQRRRVSRAIFFKCLHIYIMYIFFFRKIIIIARRKDDHISAFLLFLSLVIFHEDGRVLKKRVLLWRYSNSVDNIYDEGSEDCLFFC